VGLIIKTVYQFSQRTKLTEAKSHVAVQRNTSSWCRSPTAMQRVARLRACLLLLLSTSYTKYQISIYSC